MAEQDASETACDCCQECRWRYGDMRGMARIEVRDRLGAMRLALERIAAEDWRGHEPTAVRIAREALQKGEDGDRDV